MDTLRGADQVTGRIADIERRRRQTEMEAGRGAAGAMAMRSLQELLDRENEALRLQGQSSERDANIAAVTMAIDRVTRLAGMTGRLSLPVRTSAQPKEAANGKRPPVRNSPDSPRNRGRRSLGGGSER
jgi:hypothetical protein